MRLLTLTLENWRAVSHSHIEFDNGVTLIEGPNEVGKSSLVEALRMLFREKSGSKKREVQAVQPVGEDVGSSVVAEIRCGDHHFHYSKTYNRKSSTELRILAPQAEQLTGDDAHNRAWDILSNHMDMALWDALLVEQGKEIGGVKLADSDGLARALDNAAGGAGVSGEESALFGAVQAEYERYFTLKTGKPRYGDEQQRVEQHREKVQQLETTLRDLEGDLRRHENVSAEISRLQRALPELQAAREQHEQRWQAIDTLQARLSAREEEGKPLQQLLAHARNQWQKRRDLAADIARREQGLEQQQSALLPLTEQVAELDGIVQAGDAALKDLQSRRQTLRQALQQAQRDAACVQDSAELSRLQQLLERVQTQRGELTELRNTLAGIHITAEGRRDIQAAASALEVASRTRDNAATRLRIEALQVADFSLDGETISLSPDAPLERQVAESLQIEIPELARITIAPAASAGELTAEVEARQQELDALLARYQAPSVEQAITLDEQRADAEQSLRAARQRLDDTLQGADEETLQADCARLQQTCEDAQQQREPGQTLPANEREAKAQLDTARAALDACESELDREGGRLAEQRDELTRGQAKRQQADTEVNALTSVLEDKRASLAQEREAEPDDALERAVAEREQRLTAINAELEQLRAELQAQDPDSARLQRDNAAKALGRAERDIIEQQQEQAVLKSRLDRAQANGLFEDLETAEQALTEAEDTLAATERRAAAAKLLWETLNEHRDASRQAYVAPLREGIRNLGKIVFGSDFDIALAEDWTILNVTRQGQTVPFDSLSVGAKEQLGILTRLAAARIVADQGGVPVIIDDALGFSDPSRLQSMGAAITAAGRDAQVVVLTCTPGRFMYLGEVGVRRL
ncbi:AAA family ATPase [Kineobactrum salinum]|uniref:AAA family ATPase n=1 Tax=Kineobactrum salinum TaxID=2708301 RepID=A0A6C0U5B0_9GAMM|nr:AAA family ATPase [Kineobactrum salinum]QIB67033.1 AAA family ATPase [Kineobactrum salinum]